MRYTLRIRRFRDNCAANVAVIVGLTLPVITFCMAGAVDLSGIYRADRNLQQSIDVAALAAGREYTKNQDNEYLSNVAEGFFHQNLMDGAGDVQFAYEGIKRIDGSSVLTVSATRQYPTFFGDFLLFVSGKNVDWRAFPMRASSQVVVQNMSIELALVLDNSGSMESRPSSGKRKKIDTIQDAAEGLAEQFLLSDNKGGKQEFPVSFSVVPFSSAVNVGEDNADAPWMDTDGISPIHNEHLDWANWRTTSAGGGKNLAERNGLGWRHAVTKKPLTRFYVYENYQFESKYGGWAGCVESRPGGLALTDEVPSRKNPASLFVPTFAPDEYDDGLNWGGRGWNDYIESKTIPEKSTPSAIQAMAEQAMIEKYFNKDFEKKNTLNGDPGPNSTCLTTPITPLTDDAKTVVKALKKMKAGGNTNIPEGLAWGWRTLTAGEPYTQGLPHSVEDNMKVLVLMTDGNSTYNPTNPYTGGALNIDDYNRSTYGSFGYGATYAGNTRKPGRIYDGTSRTAKNYTGDSYVAAMDEHIATLCENIKADGRKPGGGDGIIVFTIAFDLKNGEPVKKLMEDCASEAFNGSGSKLYYDAQDEDDLSAAFASITEEISSLRISE